MLTRLTLRNFQPWEVLALDLEPGVNVLTGPSDAGKSSVLRGLKWVCLNQPDGDSMIRRGAGQARASLEVDGRRIARRRGKANSYRVDKETPLVSFGRGKVPSDVSSILNVGELCFQDQHSAPFWLALPAPEVSRQLNRVVNLDLIDQALGKAASELTRAKAEEDVCSSRLAAALARRDALKWVKEAQALWDRAEGLRMEAVQNRNKALLGGSLLAKAAGATLALQNAATGLTAAKQALAAGEAALEARQKAETLHNYVHKVNELSAQIQPKLPSLTEVERVEALAGGVLAAQEKRDRLKELAEKVERLNSERERAASDSKAVRERLAELVGETCPLCGRLL